jgi:hypothetical protein
MDSSQFGNMLHEIACRVSCNHISALDTRTKYQFGRGIYYAMGEIFGGGGSGIHKALFLGCHALAHTTQQIQTLRAHGGRVQQLFSKQGQGRH